MTRWVRHVAAVGMLFSGVTVAAWPGQQPASATDRTEAIRRLSGVWTADVYKVTLSSELDVQVWGKNASRVRKVNLTLEPWGNGIVTIYTSVEDARGRTKAYSASIVEARVVVGPSPSGAAMPDSLAVKVVTAEERYLDASGDRRPLEGIRLSVSTVEDHPDLLNIGYDTPQGNGSFGDTLHRRTAGERRPPA